MNWVFPSRCFFLIQHRLQFFAGATGVAVVGNIQVRYNIYNIALSVNFLVIVVSDGFRLLT